MSKYSVGNVGQGIDNRSPRAVVQDGYVSDANNVDFLPSGAATLINPPEQVYSAVGTLRGGIPMQDGVIVADDTDIVLVRQSGSEVIGSIGAGESLVGAEHNGVAYLFTTSQILTYDGSGSAKQTVPDCWGFSARAVASSGSLREGIYRVAVVYEDSDGRQGGVPAAAVVSVSEDDSKIRVVATAVSGYTAVVYATQADGEVFFRQFVMSTTTEDLTIAQADSDVIDTVGLRTMVPGAAYAVSAGAQLAAAAGAFIEVSEPLLPGAQTLTNPARRFFQATGDVRFLAWSKPSRQLVYGDGTGVYSIAGIDSDQPERRSLSSDPPVPGSAAQLADNRVVWADVTGAKVFDGQSVANLTSDVFAFERMRSAAAGVVRRNGTESVVVAPRGLTRNNGLIFEERYDYEVVPPKTETS